MGLSSDEKKSSNPPVDVDLGSSCSGGVDELEYLEVGFSSGVVMFTNGPNCLLTCRGK